jgi:hypothetical protein
MRMLAILVLSLCLASAAGPALAGKGHNSVSISRHGPGNYATVSQSGSYNSASVSQTTY